MAQEDGVKFNKGKFISDVEKGLIRKLVSYDPESGRIARRDNPKFTGSFDKDGYLIIKVKCKQYKAHRLAWFLYYGEFPEMEIDHINRNRADNRICNLREVTRGDNTRNENKTPNPKTGVIGIYHDECTRGLKSKFTTRYQGKTYRFRTLDEAIKFRLTHGCAV